MFRWLDEAGQRVESPPRPSEAERLVAASRGLRWRFGPLSLLARHRDFLLDRFGRRFGWLRGFESKQLEQPIDQTHKNSLSLPSVLPGFYRAILQQKIIKSSRL